VWTEFRKGRQFKTTEDGRRREWLWKLLLKTPDETPPVFQENFISIPPWEK